MAGGLAVYTVATQNYFHFAKTLMSSVAHHGWQADRYVIALDSAPQSPATFSELFSIVELLDLFPEPPKKSLFRYTALEMAASIKPLAMEYLFRAGYSKVIFLDADILVMGPADYIVSQLDHVDVLFTPHITAPLEDLLRPNDLDILRAGVANAGFFAARNGRCAERFLTWWQSKLATQCIVAPEQGLVAEQKWLELVPSLFPGVSVDRSPGLNVAYWNLPHRDVTKRRDTYFVGDSPVIFFHFSGVVPENPSILSRYETRFANGKMPLAIQGLLCEYVDLLRGNGLEEYQHRPYGFDFFSDNLTRIPPAVRKMYREYQSIQEAFGDDPFDVSRDPDFASTYNRSIRSDRPNLTWLAYEIYRGSKELSARFRHVPGLDTDDYLLWLSSVMASQYGLTETFLRPLRMHRPLQSSAVLGPALNRVRSLAKFTLVRAASYIERFDSSDGDRPSPTSSPGQALHQARAFRAWKKPLLNRLKGLLRRVPRLKTAGRSILDVIKSPPATVTKWIDPGLSTAGTTSQALSLVGPLHAQTGLGESARSTIRAATAAGFRVAALEVPASADSSRCEAVPPHIAPAPDMSCPVNIINVSAHFFHHVLLELGERFLEGKYNIAYWVWEMRYFPHAWKRWLPYVNEIWTPSTFSQDALARGAGVPVVRIPHCLHSETPTSIGRRELGLPETGFMFLSAVDFLSVPERKNPLGTVEAFLRAFGGNCTEAYLCLKLSNTGHRPDVMTQLEEMSNGCRSILLMRSALDRPSMNALINSCDAYISLHRSEGFGLPMAEAMALGKPVIATGWSGNMDFMHVGNSFPVRFDLVELTEDLDPFEKGHSWASPDLDHAALLMKDLVQNRDLAEHIGRKAAAHMVREFSPERVGQMIKARIELLPMK